eukprot:CAMPEP_0185774948 /NCGR_PEP_ID=MMETSP1174-20130828/80523_1 /TAXON_ID=35687 /ORGANISM="Dictyocha speculum, Strain CCMP1381" /LENGTH=84 /DNA_ID=CAMNT_0028462357 /DNA_START=46 /DNA_END=297 /DNA_ORIENTATION=-
MTGYRSAFVGGVVCTWYVGSAMAGFETTSPSWWSTWASRLSQRGTPRRNPVAFTTPAGTGDRHTHVSWLSTRGMNLPLPRRMHA